MREMDEVAEKMQRENAKIRLEFADDALALAAVKIKKLQDANNFLQGELMALGDECSSLDQEFKKLGRLCMDTEHVRQAKAVLAHVGGKRERLHGKNGSLHNMANAAVAQHRRMTKLLEAMQRRHSAARQTFEVAKGRLKRREGEAIEEKKDAQRECEEQERRGCQLYFRDGRAQALHGIYEGGAEPNAGSTASSYC